MQGFFSPDSVLAVNTLLYGEGQEESLEGQCNQANKGEALKKPRSPAEQRADQRRAQTNRGKDNTPAATRSAAAAKAAVTKAQCKGAAKQPKPRTASG